MDWSVVLTSSVVAAGVSGLINLIALFVQNRLTRERERRQQIWQQKQEDIRELESQAGYLTEYLAGYQQIEYESDELWKALEKVRELKYRLRKYPEVLEAIRKFRNEAGFRLREGKEYSSPKEKERAVQDIEDRYDELIQACREELDKDEV